MTIKDVPIRAPVVAPGAGVTEALKAGVYMCKGPSFSVADIDPTGTTIELFRVPAGTFVHDVILKVKTVWDGTGTPTFTIGDSDGADSYMLSAISLLKTAGSKSIKTGTAVKSGGYLYTADATISATATDSGASSSGTAEVYLIYSNYGDLL